MKLIDRRIMQADRRCSKHIKNGTIFTGKVGFGSEGGPYIKGYGDIVELATGRSWGDPECEVYDFQPVEVTVTITSNLPIVAGVK